MSVLNHVVYVDGNISRYQKVELVKTTVYSAVMAFLSIFLIFTSASGEENDLSEVLFIL
jgi:hypothetical protein